MRILRFILFAMIAFGCTAAAMADESTKTERNLIKEGNKLFNEGNYAKALKLYQDALREVPTSDAAQYNIAVAMGKLSSAPDDTLGRQAAKIYELLSKSATDQQVKEKACYNLGNQEFHKQNYQGSIDLYKAALRINPSNTKTRENLLVAQLKLQQQQQGGGQDNQNQDQDKKDEQEQQEQQQQEQQQQQQQAQQNEVSGNAEQILQTMQNRENQTRENVKEDEKNAARRVTDKPW